MPVTATTATTATTAGETDTAPAEDTAPLENDVSSAETTVEAAPAWSWDTWDGRVDAIPAEQRGAWDAAFRHAQTAFEEEIEILRGLFPERALGADRDVDMEDAPPAKERAFTDYPEYKDLVGKMTGWEQRAAEWETQKREYADKLAAYEQTVAQLRWLEDYYEGESRKWADTVMSRPELKNPEEKAYLIEALEFGVDPEQAVRLLGAPSAAKEMAMRLIMQGSSHRFAIDQALQKRATVHIPDSRGLQPGAGTMTTDVDLNDPALPLSKAVRLAMQRIRG